MAAQGDDLLRQRLVEVPGRPWHASGSFAPSAAPTLSFTAADGRRVTLPLGAAAPPPEALDTLLAAATASPLAKKGKTVVDTSYRAALELLPELFDCEQGLPPKGVLAEIAAVLAPDATAVCAELLKLNVYGPGAFFKAHRDTPQGGQHVGSLVICLPCGPHQGGALKLSHLGQEHTWSAEEAVAGRGSGSAGSGAGAAAGGAGGSREVGAPALEWIAFFPDVEHEVLPVTSGHRLTLSFNIYSSATPPTAGIAAAAVAASTAAGPSTRGSKRKAPSAATEAKARGLPVVSASLDRDRRAPSLSAEADAPQAVAALRTLLADASWQPAGAKLGVILGHKYAAGLEGLTDTMFPAALKGRDRLLYSVFASCGLQPKAVPIFRGWEDPEEVGYDPYEEDMAGLDIDACRQEGQVAEAAEAEEPPRPSRSEWYLGKVCVADKGFDATRRKLAGEGLGPWDAPPYYSDDVGVEDFNAEIGARPASKLGIKWVTPLDEETAFLHADKVAATGNGSLWYMNWMSGAALLIQVLPAGQGARSAAAARAGGRAGRSAAVCGNPGCGATEHLRKCTGCKLVRYCGQKCQLAHWPAHRKECRRLDK